MWKILNHKTANDFVMGTGEPHTVREFVEKVFKVINIEIGWEGKGLNEVGVADNKILMKMNKEFFRPLETDNFIVDYPKARTQLGWKPKTSFKELVKIMVGQDLRL
ncbi:MAG: GDP-mannose 4,6-dehydratase [Candidatus Parvarchaeota archaeon]